MSDVASGDLVDMRQVLPAQTLRELVHGLSAVLTLAQARGADTERQAAWVAAWVAPMLALQGLEFAEAERAALLADLRLQLDQSGAALSTMVDEANRLAAIEGRRAEVCRRLRAELWPALDDAGAYRSLTEQTCPAGLHDGWFVPSEHAYACPWCMVNELRAATPKAAGLAQHLHRLAAALGILGSEEDIDPYRAVRDLQTAVDRLRDEVASQPGYADRHRGCVTIGGGYCVDRHDDESTSDGVS